MQGGKISDRYLCLRGTNPLEGFHHLYEQCVEAFFTGLALNQALSLDQIFMWNLLMGLIRRECSLTDSLYIP